MKFKKIYILVFEGENCTASLATVREFGQLVFF